MFDYIKTPELLCECGEKLTGFQSKDGECSLLELDYWQVDNFYTSCNSCNKRVTYSRFNDKPYVPISDYEQVTR
jgi:hypothetical protein